MPTLTSVTKHFITAQEGFTTTTAGSVASGAATVTLNSVSGYTNGDQVAFVIDPTDVTKKQVFTGTIDTSGVQVTNVVWTEGTNQTHAAGATVVDYTTATHQAAMVKGVKVSLDQDGTLKAGAVDNSAAIANDVVDSQHYVAGSLDTEHYSDASITPVKISAMNRQDNTTNTTTTAPLIQHGWGFVPGNGTAAAVKSVTFPVAYSSTPTVHITGLGVKSGSDPSSQSDDSGANIERKTIIRAEDSATTGFTVAIHMGDAGNTSSSMRYIFSWLAIGPS